MSASSSHPIYSGSTDSTLLCVNLFRAHNSTRLSRIKAFSCLSGSFPSEDLPPPHVPPTIRVVSSAVASGHFSCPQIGAGHYRYPPYISMEPTTLGIRSRRWRDAVGYRGIPKQIARLQRVVMGRDAWCANTSFSGRSATSVAIRLLCFLDRVLARVSSPCGFFSQTL